MLIAAGDDLASPVLALVGVLVTAAVTFMTTWRWPTRRRRILDHVAIVKDLPDEYGGELRQLLELELYQLARADRAKVEMPAVRQVQLLYRLFLSTIPLVGGSYFVVAISGHLSAAIVVLGVGATVQAVWALAVVVMWRTRAMPQRRRVLLRRHKEGQARRGY